MKVSRLIKWPLWAIAIVLIAVTAVVFVLQEPVPPPGVAAGDSSRLYDGYYSEPVQAVSAELDNDRISLAAPSISVAVGVNGELVWADARGYADIKSRTIATPDTVYAIASVSKPITAVLTALLWQQGVLDIDTDIRQYVPGYPAKAWPVTLRQLLSHQAGLRHYRLSFMPPVFSESALNRQFASTRESLELFADDPLQFEPDTGFMYSTFGYTLISAAIEGATGLSFIDALTLNVLDPLAMSRTTIDQTGLIPGLRATDYVAAFSAEKVIQPPATNSSYKWAGGGLVSTPSDLVRLGSAMLDNSLLSEQTLRTVLTARSLDNGELNPQHYGLGWRIGGLSLPAVETGDERIITLFNHGGTRSGSTAILMVAPDHGIVVAMTANTVGRGGSGPLTRVAAQITRQFIAFEEAQDRGSPIVN